MSETAHTGGTNRPVRQFRVVRDTDVAGVTDDAQASEPRHPDGETQAFLEMVPARLLVEESTWQERFSSRPSGTIEGRATVPLIASLSAIRSEADAAIALTGVIEGLARQFQFSLPFGLIDATTVAFVAPEGADLFSAGDTVDSMLRGQVRETDLQGALAEQMVARVIRVDTDLASDSDREIAANE